MEIKELKERSQKIRAQYEGKYHVKWPSDFKKDVIDLLNSGVKMEKIYKATGIAHQTIDHWRPDKKYKKKKRNNKFKEVQLSPIAADSTLTLSWSTGLEIKGLTFLQVQELLKQGLL